jgi:hypothetical protein
MNNNKSTQYNREKTTRFPWFPRIMAMKFLDKPHAGMLVRGSHEFSESGKPFHLMR